MELGQGGNSSVDIDHIVTLCVFSTFWFVLFSYLGLGHWCGVYNYRSG